MTKSVNDGIDVYKFPSASFSRENLLKVDSNKLIKGLNELIVWAGKSISSNSIEATKLLMSNSLWSDSITPVYEDLSDGLLLVFDENCCSHCWKVACFAWASSACWRFTLKFFRAPKTWLPKLRSATTWHLYHINADRRLSQSHSISAIRRRTCQMKTHEKNTKENSELFLRILWPTVKVTMCTNKTSFRCLSGLRTRAAVKQSSCREEFNDENKRKRATARRTIKEQGRLFRSLNS